MTRKTEPVSTAPGLTRTDYETLAHFRQSLRQFIHFSEQAAAAAGIPPHQHQALLAIRGFSQNGSLNIGELASRLSIKHQSAVGLVNRMERAGLVRKSQAPADRRRVLVCLTRAGERMLKNLSAAHKAEMVRLRPTLQRILNQIKTVS